MKSSVFSRHEALGEYLVRLRFVFFFLLAVSSHRRRPPVGQRVRPGLRGRRVEALLQGSGAAPLPLRQLPAAAGVCP